MWIRHAKLHAVCFLPSLGNSLCVHPEGHNFLFLPAEAHGLLRQTSVICKHYEANRERKMVQAQGSKQATWTFICKSLVLGLSQLQSWWTWNEANMLLYSISSGLYFWDKHQGKNQQENEKLGQPFKEKGQALQHSHKYHKTSWPFFWPGLVIIVVMINTAGNLQVGICIYYRRHIAWLRWAVFFVFSYLNRGHDFALADQFPAAGFYTTFAEEQRCGLYFLA